jgi:hypothetical protein
MKTVRSSMLCLVVVLVAGTALGQGTFTQIDYPEALQSYVLGINTAGEIVSIV